MRDARRLDVAAVDVEILPVRFADGNERDSPRRRGEGGELAGRGVAEGVGVGTDWQRAGALVGNPAGGAGFRGAPVDRSAPHRGRRVGPFRPRGLTDEVERELILERGPIVRRERHAWPVAALINSVPDEPRALIPAAVPL